MALYFPDQHGGECIVQAGILKVLGNDFFKAGEPRFSTQLYVSAYFVRVCTHIFCINIFVCILVHVDVCVYTTLCMCTCVYASTFM